MLVNVFFFQAEDGIRDNRSGSSNVVNGSSNVLSGGSGSSINTDSDGDSDSLNVLTLVHVVNVDGLGGSQKGGHGHRGGDNKLGVENHIGSKVDFSSVEIGSVKIETCNIDLKKVKK